jgi:TetR/AcrR family transcriptional regulator, transcriptional repressor of bet genes
VTAAAERQGRRPVDKFTARRNELAEAALKTLAERGYAQTGLRDIAQNSEFSHGVLHYYFADKTDLITHCVREYKAVCVTRYDEVVETATTAAELATGFLDKLAETLTDEAPMHRLWYDLRTQSMFEESLREAVLMIDGTLQDMIWRVVSRYAELSGAEVAMTPTAAYGVLDGLFQQALLGHVAGDAAALPTLVDQVHALMPLTLQP